MNETEVFRKSSNNLSIIHDFSICDVESKIFSYNPTKSCVVLIICSLSVITVSFFRCVCKFTTEGFKHQDERMKSPTFLKREPVHTNTMRRERFFSASCVCRLSAAASPQTLMLPFSHASISILSRQLHVNLFSLQHSPSSHESALTVLKLTKPKTI